MMTPWRVSLAHYYSLSITVPENCSRRSQQRRVVTLTTPNYLPIVDFNSQFAMRKRSKGLTRAHCTLGARIARVCWVVGAVVPCAWYALYGGMDPRMRDLSARKGYF